MNNINNLQEEIWVPIQDYEGLYMVSNKSRIRSCTRRVFTHNNTRAKLLNSQIIKKGKRKGYLCINLWKNNKVETINTHRLIAIHFIQNPFNLKIVEHKDDNKLNDSIDNLKWSTTSNNVTNGHYRSSKHLIKPVIQYDLQGNFIAEFDSISNAARAITDNLNSGKSCINKVCKNITSSYLGYKYKYKTQ